MESGQRGRRAQRPGVQALEPEELGPGADTVTHTLQGRGPRVLTVRESPRAATTWMSAGLRVCTGKTDKHLSLWGGSYHQNPVLLAFRPGTRPMCEFGLCETEHLWCRGGRGQGKTASPSETQPSNLDLWEGRGVERVEGRRGGQDAWAPWDPSTLVPAVTWDTSCDRSA